MKFVKNILTILIINSIISDRRYNFKSRFFRKLRINNAKTFNL